MRVVFIGSSRFGLRCLDRLSNMSECLVVGAITAPERINISYSPSGFINVLHGNVKEYCEQNNIPYVVTESGMNEEGLFKVAQDWNPDAFIVVGWYHMIPKRWRDLAPCYGLHASLLPDYSGGAPLVWAIINGESRTGITFFKLADGVDNGPIVGQVETEIFENDDIATLYGRIEELGLEIICNCVPKLSNGSIVFQSQDENRRRIFPQRSPEDGKIDWSKPANEVYDFIRAQTRPYPGAFTLVNSSKIYIWKSRLVRNLVKSVFGSISIEDDRVLVCCGDGYSIAIEEISIDGIMISPLEGLGDSIRVA